MSSQDSPSFQKIKENFAFSLAYGRSSDENLFVGMIYLEFVGIIYIDPCVGEIIVVLLAYL